MVIHHLVVYKNVINAFNPEEKLERHFDLGYFTNKKKANQAFVDLCDEEIDWLVRVYLERIEVETDYPGELKTRIKKKGEIVWFVGTIEKITVQ